LLLGAAALAVAAIASAPAVAGCEEEVGEAQAQTFVEQCLEVSPATHPPCNAANPCAMMLEEIARGCAFLGEDGGDIPEFCDARPEAVGAPDSPGQRRR
jgi:hypothetical protein